MQEIDFDKVLLEEYKRRFAYVVDGVGYKNREDAIKQANGIKIDLSQVKPAKKNKERQA